MRWVRRAFARGERRLGRVDPMLRQALLRILDHDLDAAEDLLSRIVRIDSDEIDAYLALARLYRARGEVGRAIHIHQNLLLRRDLEPGRRQEALAGLAGDFQQGGFLRRAIAAYEELLARQSRHVGALRALGRLLADARDFPRALEMQRRLARCEGRDHREAEAALRVEMAEVFRAEGRSDEARRALRKALRGNPRSVEAWIRLGELEAERGRTAKALDAWRQLPRLDRRSGPRVYAKLEATYAALGRSRDYENFLNQLLESQPRDASARLALARALAARGAIDEAIAQARRVLDQDPDHLEAYATLVRVLLSEPREPELSKVMVEFLDVLERHGLTLPRERSE